jgi:hypothetical protein
MPGVRVSSRGNGVRGIVVWVGGFTVLLGVFTGMVGVDVRVALARGRSVSVGVEGGGVTLGKGFCSCGVAVEEQAASSNAKKAISMNLSKSVFISTSPTCIFNKILTLL